MNKFKNKLSVKLTLFVFLQFCITVFVLSSVAVIFNAVNGWYSENEKTAHDDMFYTMADDFSTCLADDLCELYYRDGYYSYGINYIAQDSDVPSGVGYVISFDETENIQAGSLENVVLEKNMQTQSDVYTETFTHYIEGEVDVTVSLADPDQYDGDIQELYPERLAKLYIIQCKLFEYQDKALAVSLISLLVIIALIAFMFSIAAIGRKENSFLNKLPLDFIAVAAFVISLCAFAGFIDIGSNYTESYEMDFIILVFIVTVLIISTSICGVVWLFVARVKQGAWWKCTVIYNICKLAKHLTVNMLRVMNKVIRKLPLVWKSVLTVVIMLVINFIIAVEMYWSGVALLAWIFGAVLIVVGAGYISLCLQQLAKGAKCIAEGNIGYQIDKKMLLGDFADHADNLNSIGNSITAAVEQRMKSERFKAELITNVSHDIKTPLTSIINYVDLLKKENINDEKVTSYIEVLDRQSKRLKKLTEDILDASKASTGNISINLEPCQVGVLMTQTMGEYKERAENENLQFIMKIPEDDLKIMADGKRMWRVFDNLLNNICKYAQPNTRVYMNLAETDGKAVITYRNISRYELDITEEELMERFVRGDKSRNTEGSGLGLSISRNLVELQGGEFEIYIDGDLFKVVMKFDVIK